MLKQVIEQSGQSRTEWAARLGISRPFLSLLEGGKRQPSLELAVRIERATDGQVPASSWVPDASDQDDTGAT
jgi:DNA-binding XRE family transcriptional regulator